MIWQIIIDFLKLSDFDQFSLSNALFSLFLTAYHYNLSVFFPSHRYQSRCHRRLPNLNVPYCMSSLDIYVSLKPEAIKILKLRVFLIVIFHLGLLHLDFNQVLYVAWRNSLSSIPLTFLSPVCKPYGHLLEEWFWLPKLRNIKSARKLAILICIINASLHGGIVNVQQGWGVSTHFVDIYHLFTSAEKMRGMFQIHNFSLTF